MRSGGPSTLPGEESRGWVDAKLAHSGVGRRKKYDNGKPGVDNCRWRKAPSR
jgi:hypothetical protein